MANQLFVIAPYRKNETWVFDDPGVGLEAEPFVVGIPEIIDWALDREGLGKVDRFRLIFSAAPFPGALKLERQNEEDGGTWYRETESGKTGWLCPALFEYFAIAPPTLYCKPEALEHAEVSSVSK